METIKTLLTFDEFEQLPDHPGKRELLKGELIESPPAKKKHNKTGKRIYNRTHSALEHAHAHGEAAELGEAYQGNGLPAGRRRLAPT